MKTFDDLQQKIDQFNEKILKEGSELFREISKEIFDKYSEVDSFSWTQYTPYFNDGEECVFRVNEVDLINGEDEYDNKDGFWKGYSWKVEECDPRKKEVVDSIRGFINSAPEEVLKSTFGDHSRVTVYRDSDVEVESYEHD